ncbi:MAG TPA: septal ring lytic transglycosylase RlpA family protein [Methylophilaceae bacterium]|nr:septal ring lytic transglycosylase RlpA family protein [Methylophilaceae bacterium]
MINISLQNPLRLLLPISFSLLLAACGGGTAVKPDKTGTETPGTAKSAPAPYTPPKRGGGYYLDDGPGDNPPPDIDSIPDAMPRVEPLLARANRPYSALGSRYTPMTEFKPYKKRGLASWYGKRYHGQKTSSGEIYDMYSMTGAHTTLPLPSYARVTNPENGRSVIVRINDRGPFHSDRLIDLSYAAAYKLRLLEKGSGIVEVEAIDPRNPTPINPAPQPAAEPAASNPTVLEPAPADTAAISAADNAAQPMNGDFVQVGAFKYKTNAENLISKLKGQSLTENVNVESWYNAGTYRVRLGPYANRQDAERAATKIRQAFGTSAVLIRK